jgi:hypothetical protein
MTQLQKKIFLALSIINCVAQLADDDLKLSNWVSAFSFLIAALFFFFQKNSTKP